MPNLQYQNIQFQKTHTPKHGVEIPENCFGRILFKDKPTYFCICRIDNCGEVISFANRSRNSLYNHIEHHNKTNTNVPGSNKRPRNEFIKCDNYSVYFQISYKYLQFKTPISLLNSKTELNGTFDMKWTYLLLFN